MRYYCMFIALFFLVAGESLASPVDRDLLAQLDSDNAIEALSKMKLHPKEYVKLLVEQLTTTGNTDKITFDNINERRVDLHNVWVVRALRYLTGVQFSAPFNPEAPTEGIRFQFLRKSEGNLKFFGVKMSTETIYLAPIDVQVEIIKNWHRWSCENIDTHSYPDEVDINEWYF